MTSNLLNSTTSPTSEADKSAGRKQDPRQTKTSRLIGMLRRKNGTSAAGIGRALGWQPHTVRAAISGLRKAGYSVATAKAAKDRAGPTYRIIAEPSSGNTAHGLPEVEE
ncbi:MAG: hypothetical protein C0606_13365 [Hyphomicrobiales bacterium]|nr:MAG: hypothetical protein C0606_13365 [Hyphomicrobiales bacterium]